MKMRPSGAHSVPGVNTISGISDAYKAFSAGLVGRDSGDRKLIMPCILRAKELDALLDIDVRVSEECWSRPNLHMSTMIASHPLLQYAAHYVFPHAAQAEQHGVSQDGFRAYFCGNIEACFERWRYLQDMMCDDNYGPYQGVGARPIHIFAAHGLLSKEIAEKEANIDIAGGIHDSALATACLQGHEDTMELLLSLGADPTRTRPSPAYPRGMHAFVGATDNQHLPILRRLLNDWRSSLTLSDRLSFVEFLKEDSSPHLKAILDLLFPEATFPNSAIHDVCSIAKECTPRILSFLLDKSQESILHEEKLWFNIVSNQRDARMSKLRNLLDRGGKIKITGTLLRYCRWDRDNDWILLLLSENCEVEMTEDLMDAICLLEDLSQTLSAFESAGHRFNAFTRRHLLRVLECGSAESAAFFLQRNNYNVSTDEILISALGNTYNGLGVSRLLLGYLNPESITEQAFIAALENERDGGDLVRLLYSRRSALMLSEAALAVAVRVHHSDVIKFILENSERVKISEEILTGVIRRRYLPDVDKTKIVDILLLHDPDIQVRESTVIDAIRSLSDPTRILETFRKHNKPLFCTEDVVIATFNSLNSFELPVLVLQQDRSMKISSTMIMAAMRARNAALLISVMLHHDHTVVIRDEHLIAAAASNSDNPSLIFELLQTRGKLDIADPASKSLSAGTAKRRKISHIPPLRISTGVLNAALSNPEEQARGLLLRLFLKWGIITETDYTNGMSKPSNSSYRPSTVTLPSISELFPDL